MGERNTVLSMLANVATPHHHPLLIEGRLQPTRLRSVARTARARLACAWRCHPRPRPPLRLCMLRGSGQSATPACRSQLSSAGCAVCPSRRSHTQAAPSVPHSAAHTQPPLWAWPNERSIRAGGAVPRGGAHSATADGLLHRRARPRVVMGCGTRSSPILRAHESTSEAQAASRARSIPSRLPTAIRPRVSPRRCPPPLESVTEGLVTATLDSRRPLRTRRPPPMPSRPSPRPRRTTWRGTPSPP